MTSCGGSFHDSIQFGSIGGGHAIPAFIEAAHAGHQTVEVAGPIPVVESIGERFGVKVHRRSVERALARAERADRDTPDEESEDD